MRLSSIQALIKIRQDILEGRFELGQHLVEADLAERYNMSRTPIREALLQLQAEGLVVIGPGRGVRVSTYSIADLQEIYGIRSVLEGYAARLAATRISEEDLVRLEQICDSMQAVPLEHNDVATMQYLIDNNTEFHDLIWNAAKSKRLRTHLRLLVGLPLVYKMRFWQMREQRLRAMHYHRELVAILRRREAPMAEALMMCHIFASIDALLINPSNDEPETGGDIPAQMTNSENSCTSNPPSMHTERT